MFRYKTGIGVSYNRQGYIYFASRMYRELPEGKRRKLEALCRRCGGESWQALLAFVTSDAGADAVCDRHYLSRSTLHRMVRRYYREFPKIL